MSSKKGSHDNVIFLRHLVMAKVTLNIQKCIKHDIYIKMHKNITKHLKIKYKMSVMLDTKTQVYHTSHDPELG